MTQRGTTRRAGAGQRRRMRQKRRQIIGYALVALLVFAAVYVIQMESDLRFGAEVFYQGTYLNGVPLEGKTYDEAVAEMDALSQSMLAGTSIRLTFGERAWSLTPADIGAAIDCSEAIDQAWSYAREGSKIARRAQIRALRSSPIMLAADLKYDEAALESFVYAIKAEVDTEPVEAYVTVVGYEQLEVSQSRTGLTVDADALIAQLTDAMLMGGEYDIALQPAVTEPEHSTQALLDATQLIARKSTTTENSSSDRTANIRLALSNFNGICIPAGMQVSFNAIVGERNEARGYNNAMEYAGTSFTEGFGGGVCQASTTLYDAVLEAGLQIDKRSNHNMTVGYVKPSFDAAVNNETKDLVFTNNSGYPLYFFTHVTSEKATVSIFGKPSEYQIVLRSETLDTNIPAKEIRYKQDKTGKYVYYDDEHMLASEGKPGMKSQAFRDFVKDGQVVTTEVLSRDYYQPQPNVYWVGVHSRSGG